MADRSGAALFGDLFAYLAKTPDERARTFALRLWDMRSGHDFDDYQMGCDDALIALGLAQRGIDPRYPNDGEVTIYRGSRLWVEARCEPAEPTTPPAPEREAGGGDV